jgi:hypothetical protein
MGGGWTSIGRGMWRVRLFARGGTRDSRHSDGQGDCKGVCDFSYQL